MPTIAHTRTLTATKHRTPSERDQWVSSQVHADAPAPPLWSVPVLRPPEPELRELARLLRAGGADIGGVAMLEQLRCSGAKPDGNDQRALIEQLGRIRYHLIARA